ncbi:MAG TPA: family 1 glycosylhydrolase [Cellulomonas sp.]
MPWYADGRLRFALGVEDTFIHDARPGGRPLDEYELTEHYARLTDDIALLGSTGADQVRWGVPWYKVNPEPGRYDFGWLDRAAEAFAAHGVEVLVDLLHYGCPRWLDNAFLHTDYPARFAEYAATVAERYRDVWHVYTPVNEPVVTAERCGEAGAWPPFLVGADGFVRVLAAVARGAVLAQRAVAEAGPTDVSFVHVEATRRYGGETWRYPEAVAHLTERQFLHQDLVTGRVGDEHPLRSHLAAHGIGDRELAWFAEHAVAPDVLGVNHYPHVSTVQVTDTGPAARPDEWGLRHDGAEGLADILRTWHARYPAVPLHLTETGDPGDVERRIRWLEQSVRTVVDLRADGMDLVGYTWWSLFDMVGWDYRESTRPVAEHLMGHGLWDLVPDELTGLERVRTAAADTFTALAEQFGAASSTHPDPHPGRGDR